MATTLLVPGFYETEQSGSGYNLGPRVFSCLTISLIPFVRMAACVLFQAHTANDTGLHDNSSQMRIAQKFRPLMIFPIQPLPTIQMP